MNYVDWAYLLLITAAMIAGYLRGFIFTVIDIACLVIAILMGVILQQTFRVYINAVFVVSKETILLISFLLPAIIFFTLLSILLSWLKQAIPLPIIKHPANKFAGTLAAIALVCMPVYYFSSLVNQLPLSAAVVNEVKSSSAFNSISYLNNQESAKNNNDINSNTAHAEDAFFKLPFQTTEFVERPDLEELMLGIINKERHLQNQPELTADPELRQVALAHSKDMVIRGYFSHNTPEGTDPFMRIRAANIAYTFAGENLAVSQDLYKAYTLLMLSPGHRANILRPSFGRIGIGIVDAGKYGLMITQEFRD